MARDAGIFADETPEYEYLRDFDISFGLAICMTRESQLNNTHLRVTVLKLEKSGDAPACVLNFAKKTRKHHRHRFCVLVVQIVQS